MSAPDRSAWKATHFTQTVRLPAETIYAHVYETPPNATGETLWIWAVSTDREWDARVIGRNTRQGQEPTEEEAFQKANQEIHDLRLEGQQRAPRSPGEMMKALLHRLSGAGPRRPWKRGGAK